MKSLKHFFNKRTTDQEKRSTDNQTIFEEASDWEASRIFAIEKSERRAWKITFVSIFLMIVSIVAIMMMMPLKETIPYVVRVDSVTGVPDIITAMKDKRVTYDDVLDKYWLAKYVRAHETYDWYMIQKDYDLVGLLSSKNVSAQYAQLFQGSDALDKVLGKKMTISIDIVSIVPDGKGIGTVRFIKKFKSSDASSAAKTENYVATIKYDYLNPSKMKESLRLENPFGFQVMAYRVDPELTGDNK